MVPVSFLRLDGDPVRVAVAHDPFWIGRDEACDLVLDHPAVQGRHAQVRMMRGDRVITPADGACVLVGGSPAPLFALRPGDEVRLGQPADAPRLRFENRMADAFVPPGASLAEGWVNHPAFAAAPGPYAWGPGVAVAGRDPLRLSRVTTPMGPLVVKVLGPMRSNEDGDHHLRLLTALAGSPHAALAQVVDGGIAPGPPGSAPGTTVRWMAVRWVPGRVAKQAIDAGETPPVGVVTRVLVALARGLAHLHARGVRHGDVAPANVVLRDDGDGVLIDPGHAVLGDRAPGRGVAVVGTPGYLAPEVILAGGPGPTTAADVYGLAACGYALLAGRAPAHGGDVLETLALATQAPTRPSALGVPLPEPLEAALLTGLSPDPALRPTASAFAQSLEFAGAALALGDDA